ncbi:aspartyl-phosphate phosphatase Spo0E family protein [Priestia koreensis]|uniref:aspartyl-phosphate phosphatase Spo0E family protein n=1 Tax=Priestia koreensis TaxID=284581 RepID=UPI00345A26C1
MQIQNQCEAEALFLEIVQKRKKMMDIAEVQGFTSCETLRCSQELDLLLNKYQKHLSKREEKRPLFSFFQKNFALQK